ncbi:MAG: phosphatase PAP2 family protein [Candidatus Aminicenantes bacterium]|nr:phosphatase PAP2 family protein [Candidatus Aminicenantes bacterium]
MNSHNKKYLTVFLLIWFVPVCFFPGTLRAEKLSQEYRFNKEFFKAFGNDWADIITSPKGWGKSDFLNLSIIAGGGALFAIFDKDINHTFIENRSNESEDISHFVSNIGHGAFLGSFIASLYASGEIFQNHSLRKTALLSLESWMISGAIVTTMKFLIGRQRPKENEMAFFFKPLSFKSSLHSFPSGHASSVFAVAAVVAGQSDKFYVDLVSYTLASLVAISRVHDSKHWASDVFIGSAIGYFIGKKISELNRDQKSKRVNINFNFSSKSQSLTFSFYF